MRENHPVTQQERIFDNDATLMSTTDPESYINYANDAFIEVSGFSLSELEGNRIIWFVIRICRRTHSQICGLPLNRGSRGAAW
jgi:PAS domain-containing protein